MEQIERNLTDIGQSEQVGCLFSFSFFFLFFPSFFLFLFFSFL